MSTDSPPAGAPRAGWLGYAVGVALTVLALAAAWYGLGRPVPVEEAVAAGSRMQCVSYTPFTRDQSPLRPPFVITREQVERDFGFLARYFGCVRTYSVVGLEIIPEVARAHGLQVMLGAWVGVDPEVTAKEIEGVVELASRYPDVVSAVIVGNEVLLRRERTGVQMAELVRGVKARVRQPVTYADVWEFWLRHPEVAPEVDFLTIHLLPYWEDEPHGIDQALEQVRRVRERMAAAFPGRPILIGETGWPSEGRQRETAVPSRVNQARFVRGFVRMAEAEGWRYNLIEAFDQPWKREKEGAVGGYWGLFDTDRVDKGVLAGPVSNLPGWPRWLVVSLTLGAALLFAARLPRRGPGAGLAVPAVAGVGASLVAYHLHYAGVVARGWAEWAWLGAEALIALAALLLVLLRLAASEGGWRARLARAAECHAGHLLLAAGFCAAVVALQLAFDPRYRDFPFWAYVPPAAGFLWLAAAVPLAMAQRLRVLGVLLVLAAPVVVCRETLASGPALAWVAVSLVLAFVLLRSPVGTPVPTVAPAREAGPR